MNVSEESSVELHKGTIWEYTVLAWSAESSLGCVGGCFVYYLHMDINIMYIYNVGIRILARFDIFQEFFSTGPMAKRRPTVQELNNLHKNVPIFIFQAHLAYLRFSKKLTRLYGHVESQRLLRHPETFTTQAIPRHLCLYSG